MTRAERLEPIQNALLQPQGGQILPVGVFRHHADLAPLAAHDDRRHRADQVGINRLNTLLANLILERLVLDVAQKGGHIQAARPRYGDEVVLVDEALAVNEKGPEELGVEVQKQLLALTLGGHTGLQARHTPARKLLVRPHGIGQVFRFGQRRGAFPGILGITVAKLKRPGVILGTQGKRVPGDADFIAVVLFDLLQAHGRRIAPGSQIVRELDDFDWRIHNYSPLFSCNLAMTASWMRPFEITAVPL